MQDYIVTKRSSKYTLAHEVGHVLDLTHVFDSDLLMFGLGTDNITNPPPEIVGTESNSIRNND